MEGVFFPNHLILAGRGLNHAGKSRSPGAHAYVNPATGDAVDVFTGKVVSIGNLFAVVTIANNIGLPTVKVDNHLADGWGPLQLGHVILVAIAFEAGGPKTTAAWPVKAKGILQPANVEKLGTITALKANFGFIKPGDGSLDAFFHFSEVRGFT